MKMRVFWGLLLAGFATLNVYAFVASDLAGLVDYLTNLGPWGTLATADVAIALIIGMSWMWRDARAKGIAPTPYVALTLVSGSLGLLLYLVRHGSSVPPAVKASTTPSNAGLAA